MLGYGMGNYKDSTLEKLADKLTAFYEIVPRGMAVDSSTADPLKYQEPSKTRTTPKGELLTVSLRYKTPRGRTSSLIRAVVTDSGTRLDHARADFRFASAVAPLGMLLLDSPHKGSATFESVIQVADAAVREKPSKYGTEFLELVAKARTLHAATSQH